MKGGGCGCTTSSPTDLLPFVLALGVALMRRRKS
jgi:uncharacterized protein (TIGR03382 family)